MKEVNLSEEARACGGVLAALVSILRKIDFGEKVRVTVEEEHVKELNESLSLLTKYGLIKVHERPSDKVAIIEKVKEE